MNCVLPLSAIACLGLVACDTMNGPITRGGYDPLLPAGSTNAPTQTLEPTFSGGQFVRAAMDNTAFFKSRPNGDADADKLLKRGSSMKVISNSDSYVKVELDSGEIGFIPTVMLEDPNAAPQVPIVNPGEYQIYPPLPGSGGGVPLPVIDPAGLPPDGAIPSVIDPDAPAVTPPVPPVTPTTETFPAPAPTVEPKSESTSPPESGKTDESTPKVEQE
jgi:hypothetical protein